MLLQDKILIVLNGGGPRTNSEIAEILNGNLNSVRTANTTNVDSGYVIFEKKTKHESLMCITSCGIDRVSFMLTSSYKPPKTKEPVRDKMLAALKEGIWSTEWNKVCNARTTLYKWITLLRNEGYNITKFKKGTAVFYKLT